VSSDVNLSMELEGQRVSLDEAVGLEALGRSTSLDTPRARRLTGALVPEAFSEQQRQEALADALLRRSYNRLISTQVVLSNFAPCLFYLGGSVGVFLAQGLRGWSALQLQKAACGVFSLVLLTLALLSKARLFLPARLRPGGGVLMRSLVRMELANYVLLNACALFEFHALSFQNCPGASAFGCGQRYFISFHTAIMPKTIISQLTGRFFFFPELLRNAAFAATTLTLAHRDGSATPARVLLVLAETAGCFLYTLLAIKLCRSRDFETRHVPNVTTCPTALAPLMERVVRPLERFVRSLLDEPVLDYNTVTGIATSAVLITGVLFADETLFAVSAAINLQFLSLLLTALAGKVIGGTAAGLALLTRRLGIGSGQRSLSALGIVLDALPSEEAVLQTAMGALHTLLPSAAALAIAAFPEDGRPGDERGLAGVEVSAGTVQAHSALEAALDLGGHSGTSAAFVCDRLGAQHSVATAWSGDFPTGISTFADWRAALRGGLDSNGAAVTAPLPSGHAVMGFVTAHWTARPDDMMEKTQRLRELCEVVGAIIASKRARAKLEASQSIMTDIFPRHVVDQLLQSRPRSSAPAPDDMLAPDGTQRTKNDGALARTSSEQRLVGRRSVVRPSITGRISTGGGPGRSRLFAEAFDAVTVVFADIVGFTQLSETRPPEEVMGFLNELFTAFDDLCYTHGIYKVETIGDCFMACAGMNPRRADHAPAALRFAIEMHKAAAAVQLEGRAEATQIRIGIHTGPVTAGLIGSLRARYCLFGDTVNTSSRMESNGRPGSTQLSAATMAQCGVSAALFETRQLDVKGKGLMTAHLLPTASPAEEEVLAALGPATLCLEVTN